MSLEEEHGGSGLERRLVVLPDDAHNGTLVRNVHPPAWTSQDPEGRYNLVVVGARTAGLVASIGASLLGAKVALVERHLLGGDCLNFGCVPSKGLLRSAHAAEEARSASELGVRLGEVDVDFTAVMERMRRVRAQISEHDAAKTVAGFGVEVRLGKARFVAKDAIEVGEHRLEFSRAIIATGGRATMPPVVGLAEIGPLTNETLFSLTERPRRLAVLGGGAIGCEMGQAMRRLGSEVTIVDRGERLLRREETEPASCPGSSTCFGATFAGGDEGRTSGGPALLPRASGPDTGEHVMGHWRWSWHTEETPRRRRSRRPSRRR